MDGACGEADSGLVGGDFPLGGSFLYGGRIACAVPLALVEISPLNEVYKEEPFHCQRPGEMNVDGLASNKNKGKTGDKTGPAKGLDPLNGESVGIGGRRA